MEKPAWINSEGTLCVVLDAEGGSMVYDSESGDAIELNESQLPALARLAAAAHVAAGRLRAERREAGKPRRPTTALGA
jgi:hypothetical protein